jgi:hypothetical protein
MDTFDAIIHLAKTEGRKLKVHRDESTLNKKLPYFSLSKKDGTYNAAIFNHVGHDNADRMPFIANYILQNVCPFVDKQCDLSGFYNIELHDTYSYLNNDINYKNCLVWSKRKEDHDVILMPDLYHLIGYGGKLEKKDTLAWEHKRDKVAFYGTTTGDRDPLKNDRIQTCLWGIPHREWADLYITKVAQIPAARIAQNITLFNQIAHDYVPPDHLFTYKFCLDIPGNTCSWDRVPLILNSRSLLFKKPCTDMCFYYPLLHSREHYIACDTHNMYSQYMYYKNNSREAQLIIDNANRFTNNFLMAKHARLYLVSLFEEAAIANAP